MPLFGKPPLGQQRKPFDLAGQTGEQVDAVRSKIASLMDGATEKRAAPTAAAETAQISPAPKNTSSLAVGDALPTTVFNDNSEQRLGDSTNNREITRKSWSWQDAEGEQSIPAASNVYQRPTTPVNSDSDVHSSVTRTEDERVDKAQTANPQGSDNQPAPWPRRPSNPPEIHKPERSAPKEADSPSAPPQQRSWALPPLFESERPHSSDHTDPIATPPATASNGQFGTRIDGSSGRGEAKTDPPVADTPVAANREQPPTASTINIKGRAGGILVEIGKGHWPELLVALAERLAGAGNFFRNGAVALDLAARPLSEPELRQVHKMFTEQTLELVLVRTASPETFQVALEMGLAAQLETLEGQTTTSAQPALANLPHEHHFVYAGHLRAGQVLQRREHVLIIGDVNPGATVISDGDILVWGHLRGMAQAGANGDAKAVVAALNLIPVQLRIGDFIAIAPESKNKRGWGRQRSPIKQPEVAYLNQDRIVVEPWDATKFGGISALRQ